MENIQNYKQCVTSNVYHSITIWIFKFSFLFQLFCCFCSKKLVIFLRNMKYIENEFWMDKLVQLDFFFVKLGLNINCFVFCFIAKLLSQRFVFFNDKSCLWVFSTHVLINLDHYINRFKRTTSNLIPHHSNSWIFWLR